MANSAVVGGLHAFMGIDTAQFDKGLDRARNKLSQFKPERGVSSALQGLEQRMGDTASRAGIFGNALTAMGGAGVAAGIAVGGLAAALAGARAAMSFGDDIADTAAKLAVSTDALQEYRYAMHSLGGTYADADKALEGFSKAFGAAQAGLSARAVKPFTALGLDPKSFKTTEEALDAVVRKISALGSTAQQAAIADKLGLSAMLPALREGADRISGLREEAHRLGLVMDAGLVARAGEANDKFETLQQVVDVQLKSALVDLGPILVDLIGGAAELAKFAAAAADSFRSVEDKTAAGLRRQRTSVAAQAAELGLKIMTGREPGDAAKRRLADMNAMVARLDAELASRSQAESPRTGTALIDLSDSGGKAGKTTRGLTEEQKRLAEAQREAAREAEAQDRALTALLDNALSPSVRAMKEAAEAQAVLDRALKEGAITQAAYEEMTANLNEGLTVVGVTAPEVAGKIETISERLGQGTVEMDDWADELVDATERAADAFYGVESATDAAFRAIKDNDWVGALEAIAVAIKRLQDLFKSGATAAEKFAGAMGVVSAVGGAIGGVGGATISGAASGAAGGAALASALSITGPLGWAIAGAGALLGGISGNSSATKAKKEAAYQAALAAYQAQMEIANQKRDLELHLMELQGKSAEALALRRADELAAMDASLQAIQAQVWALEDQAEAVEKAKAALDGIKATQDGLVDAARNSLSAAYEREASALQDTIDTFTELAASLRAYGKALAGGSAGNLSRGQKAAFATGEFDRIEALARTGDKAALGQLQGAGEAYIEAVKATARDRWSVDAAVARVRSAVEASAKFADEQASLAEQQLAELKTMVGALITINQSVLSVRDAIAGLANAQQAAIDAIAQAQAAVTAAQTTANDNAAGIWTASGYAGKNPGLMDWAQSVVGQKGYDGKVIGSVDEALAYHWLHHGRAEGRAFATGGSFQVGGFGGIDSQLMAFRATPGEMVHVTHGDTLGSLARDMAALRAQGDGGARLYRVERELADLRKIYKRWDGDGMPPERAA